MLSEHDIVALAQRVHDAERMNFGASSSRDQRNEQWERIIGIVAHGHPVYNPTPDPRWHIKRASASRPPSDDVAVLMPSREFWDFIPGAGADGYSFRATYDGVLPSDQIVYAPKRPADAGAVPPPVGVSPYWTPAHTTILNGLLQQQTPNPAGDLAFVRRVAEQFAHSFPGEGWGMKRADPTRPLSNNVVARRTSTGLVGFRVVPVTATPAQIDLRGQAFEAVGPINHLGVVIAPPPPVDGPVDPPPPPPPVAPSCDLAPVLAAIAALAAKVDTQRQEVIDAVKGQSYEIDANVRMLGPVRGTIRPLKAKE